MHHGNTSHPDHATRLDNCDAGQIVPALFGANMTEKVQEGVPDTSVAAGFATMAKKY
jgi:hypothetical protein